MGTFWLEVEAFTGIYSESPDHDWVLLKFSLLIFNQLFIKFCSYLSFAIVDIKLQRLA